MNKFSSNKFLISGYYGFGNFGDDAILYMLVDSLKNNIENSEISVISNNPEKTKANYSVNSVYKLDLKNIFAEMTKSSVFISGGGSLLQDVTSVKSLIYYLILIFMAQILGKKTFIFAQGIGPIRTLAGKIFTCFLLGRASLVTVRDSESHQFLSKLGVKSIKTADPVWGIEKNSADNLVFKLNKDKINVGIQLRSWKSLTDKKLEQLAEVIRLNFSDDIYRINVISLQDIKDLAVSKKFVDILKSKNQKFCVEIVSGLNINTALDLLSQLDYLLAMRLHANLISIKYNVPTLSISYDPKVDIIAKDSGIPYVSLNDLEVNVLDCKIKELIDKKNEFISKMKDFSGKKEEEARQNIDLLIKMLVNSN